MTAIAILIVLTGLAAMAPAQDSNPTMPSPQTKPKKPAPQRPKPKSPDTRPGTDRPPIEGSMVAYVDDAIIASQVRVRFDAGFHDTAPDRAEFFYAQCSCTGRGAPGPDFPGASANVNYQEEHVLAAYAPLKRLSLFAEFAIRGIQPQSQSFVSNSYDAASETPVLGTRAGMGDLRAGFKVALASSGSQSLSLQVRAYFPTGDASRGLGTHHYSIEPSLLYYRRLSERWTVESQIGDWHPVAGSSGMAVAAAGPSRFAGDVLFGGIGPSVRLVDAGSIKVVPVAEVFAWRVLGGLQTITPFPPGCNSSTTTGCSYGAKGTTIVNLKVGARVSMGTRNSFYVGFGQALTRAVWYEHIVRAEYRLSF